MDLSEAFNLLGGFNPQQGLSAPSPTVAALANPVAPPAPAYHQPSKFRNTLGAIGDALMVGAGGHPLYRERMQQQQLGAALGSYLGNSDAALAAIFQQDPQAGLALYKMKHPEVAQAPDIVRELQSAGIDPASDQGKQILIQHLNGNGAAEPNFVRELQALGIDPHSSQALELYYGRNSPAGYLLKPPTSSAPVSGLPKVASPDDARKLPPGSHFIMPDGRIGTVPGGATDSAPSPTFR